MILDILSVVYLGISCLFYGSFASIHNVSGMIAWGISIALSLIILAMRIDHVMNRSHK